MTTKEKLFKILYLALIEIRAESNDNNKKIFEISNLLHNLPLKLSKDDCNYDLFYYVILVSSICNYGLYKWIVSNLEYILNFA